MSAFRLPFSVALFAALAVVVGGNITTVSAAQKAGLNALYEIALLQDAQLHEELQRLEAIKKEYPIARSALLPQVNITLSKVRFDEQKIVGTFFGGVGSGDISRRDEYDYNVESYSLDLNQTLFDMEQFRRLSKAGAQVVQAELSAQVAEQDLIIRLAEAYFEVLLAQSDLAFKRAEKNAVAKQLDEANERYQVGLTSQTDAKEAQAAYDLAEADEIAAINRLDNAKHALAVIVGHDINELRMLAADFPIRLPSPAEPKQWVAASLQGNLSLLTQQVGVEIAMWEVKAQSAGHWPSVSMFASKNEDDIQGGPSPRTIYNKIWGIRVNVPLFLGGETHYRTRQSEATYRQNMQMLEASRRESRRQAREAYFNVVSSVKRVAALKQALLSAETSLAANEEGFGVGIRTSAEVLTALRDVFSTKLDLVTARHDYILNTLRLKLATGALAQGDIANIEQWLQ